jgi:hypothetical protein
MVYGELGVYPFSVSVKVRMVNFWSKLVNFKFLFRFSFNHLELKFPCESQMLLCPLLSKTFFTKFDHVDRNLKDQFIHKWRSDKENSSKGICYRLFKENFEFEAYLDILSDKDRITGIVK